MSQPSSPPPPPINPYDVPERSGMSGGTKVLLGLGIGCGLLLLLCCGGLGLGTFALVKVAQSSTTEDPKRIEDIADEIVTIAVPDTLEPVLGVNVNLPVIGPVMKGSVYSDKSKENHLIVGQFNQSFADRHSLETQLRTSMSNEHHEDVEVRETETFDSQINNEPAHFTITNGLGRESKEEYWEAVGQFRGAGGPGLLIFKGRATQFTKDQVLDMLKSMK